MPGGTAPYFSTVPQDAVDGGKAGENFPPQLVHASPVSIPLTRGFAALVDAADFARVGTIKWRALLAKSGNVYAITGHGGPYLHRFLLGAPAGVLVDHRNGDGLDNRRENLRLCDRLGNARNRAWRVPRDHYRGVELLSSGRWRARIGHRHLGVFDTATEAATAFDSAAKLIYGEFARLNVEVKVLAAHGPNLGPESAAWAGEKITP